MPVVTAVILALALVTVIWPAAVAAHPLGNFTTNRYSRIEFSEERVTITYVLDFAEIPTVQEMRFLDSDDDGTVTEAEKSGWLDERMPLIVKGLRLVVGDSVLPLGVESRSLELLPGQGGLQTLRLDTRLSTNLPDDWQRNGVGGYTDRNYQDRQGWREVVVQGGAGIEIASSSAPAVDLSNELRTYPDERLTDPLNQSEATFTIVPGTSTVATYTPGEAAENVREIGNGGRATDRVAALITVEQLSPKVIGLSLLLAMFWGAVHALSPGHGKTVVAAYLIGTRGTARHAAFLGLTVTITHTAGVFALGLVTLYLSRYILPEDLYPWLSVASGLFVVGIGPTLFRSRLRGNSHHDHHHHDHVHGHHHAHGDDHHHGPSHTHSHLPPGVDGTKVTWRSLLALGLSGGLIPCPSALVLLLGSISLDRLGLGMVLVTAFSLGLAAVLTAIGLLLVYSRHLFDRFSFSPRVPSALPALSALLVSIAGVAILVSALQDAGVL